MPEADSDLPSFERNTAKETYHFEKLVHLTEDGELLPSLEDLLVLGSV